jgi:hypothetical protein
MNQSNDLLRAKLKVKHLASQARLNKFLVSTAVAGSLFFSAPAVASVANQPPEEIATDVAIGPRQKLLLDLKATIPEKLEILNPDLETKISNILFEDLGIKAYAELEGEKLNRSYGLIGAEQHLQRYPGDTIDQHGQFFREGMAPGKGAWGYISNPEYEKYYVAVQTLYLPDWSARLSYLRDWYRYRKVLVVNPHNAKSIVVVIGDSGPASWTGKHFGGSPEVMAYLELNRGKQKGAVLLFFVDDPSNKVPLGPLESKVNYD